MCLGVKQEALYGCKTRGASFAARSTSAGCVCDLFACPVSAVMSANTVQ